MPGRGSSALPKIAADITAPYPMLQTILLLSTFQPASPCRPRCARLRQARSGGGRIDRAGNTASASCIKGPVTGPRGNAASQREAQHLLRTRKYSREERSLGVTHRHLPHAPRESRVCAMDPHIPSTLRARPPSPDTSSSFLIPTTGRGPRPELSAATNVLNLKKVFSSTAPSWAPQITGHL